MRLEGASLLGKSRTGVSRCPLSQYLKLHTYLEERLIALVYRYDVFPARLHYTVDMSDQMG